jgi:nucleotide-binding universal stress UspA family protein
MHSSSTRKTRRKKILVAVEGSRSSLRALDLDSEIAEKFDAALVMVYVIRDMQLPEAMRRWPRSNWCGKPA